MAFNIDLEDLQHKALLWINKYYMRYIPENRPAFYSIEEVCPELLQFDKHYDVIKRELAAILYNTSHIPKYSEIDEVQAYITGEIYEEEYNDEEAWKVFMLYLMGKNLKDNQAKCPKTSEILKSIPNLFQAFFSVLEGGRSILLHRGPYLGYLRYHLALIVPKVSPPSLIVEEKNYTWQEGQSMMFDDTLDHKVINNSRDIRVVLIVDILRPMPGIPHFINWLVTRFIIKNLYGRKITSNLKKFNSRALRSGARNPSGS